MDPNVTRKMIIEHVERTEGADLLQHEVDDLVGMVRDLGLAP